MYCGVPEYAWLLQEIAKKRQFMGRMEELEQEMERIQQELVEAGRAEDELRDRQTELLGEMDTLQESGVPELSDTNELP